MGWIFIIFGILLIAFGSFTTYYGQHLLSQKSISSKHTTSSIIQKVLSPIEEKFLSVIYNYQKDLGLNKLIISRDGRIH